MPRFVLDLGLALGEKFEVTVVAPHSPTANRRETIDGVSVSRFRYFWPAGWERLTLGGVVAWNLRYWRNWLLVPCLMIAGVFAIVREVRRTRCVAINAHWIIPMGICAAAASVFTRVPLLIHVHAGDVYLLKRLPFGRLIARLATAQASWVYADGSHVRDTLDDLLGRPSRAVLRPMGVWIDMFRPDPTARGRDPNSIVFVGRLVEKKGVTHLLDAVASMVPEIPNVHLDIIGTGPLEAVLKSQADRLGIGGAVTFWGALAHKAVVAHLHRASVGCVPSVVDSKGETEGMPTVVIEAMAAGLRVVGSDVDGIPDVLKDQANGWLARPADSADLADKLLAALRSTDEALLTRSRADADKHDWSRVASDYGAALESVVKANSGRE